MAEWAAKRFWKKAEAVEVDGGWSVRLDGRPVKTPGKTDMVVPTKALAQAMASEWDAQEDTIDPLTMLVTRACNSAIEKVTPRRDEVAAMLADYGGSDLLCYRAEHPTELVVRQSHAWDPLLDWAADRFDARLTVTSGVLPVAQKPETLSALSAPVQAMEPFELTAFHEFVTLSGSLIIGLAQFERAFPTDHLWTISRIDEDWQAEKWGEDEEATAASNARREGFLQAATFHSMLLA